MSNKRRSEELIEELETGMTEWDDEDEEVVVLRASSFICPAPRADNI
jgi:hypothetical protein